MTNPHSFKLDDVKILGTSGQNVNDILMWVLSVTFLPLSTAGLSDRHSDLANGVEVLERCLHYRHIAPTCPDTLTCFPFNQSDPFVLEETPHVMFAGDQPSFMTRRIHGFPTTSCVCG